MLLGQIVAISFAMNLFFLAILLSPDPRLLKTGITPPKRSEHQDRGTDSDLGSDGPGLVIEQKHTRLQESPGESTWIPWKILYTIPLLLTFASIRLIPDSVHTSYFLPLLAAPHILPFIPVIVHDVAPRSWGREQASTMSMDEQYVAVYRLMMWCDCWLYRWVTGIVLLDVNVAGSNFVHLLNDSYSGHSGDEPWPNVLRIRRLVMELFSHPAVSSVGWDVILCWLSAIVWLSIDSQYFLRLLYQEFPLWKPSKSSNMVQPETQDLSDQSSKDT